MEVRLRKLRDEDWETLVHLADNPKIADNLRDTFPHPYTAEDARKFILAAKYDTKSIRRAIEWNGQYVGNVGLHFSDDVYRYNAEIGYFIGEDFWGKGIASQAIPLMLELGFEESSIHRVFAGVFSYNPASMRVLEKSGFRYEGMGLECISKHGRFYDEHRYAMLKSEFSGKQSN